MIDTWLCDIKQQESTEVMEGLISWACFGGNIFAGYFKITLFDCHLFSATVALKWTVGLYLEDNIIWSKLTSLKLKELDGYIT